MSRERRDQERTQRHKLHSHIGDANVAAFLPSSDGSHAWFTADGVRGDLRIWEIEDTFEAENGLKRLAEAAAVIVVVRRNSELGEKSAAKLRAAIEKALEEVRS